jgi:hypothetical protein
MEGTHRDWVLKERTFYICHLSLGAYVNTEIQSFLPFWRCMEVDDGPNFATMKKEGIIFNTCSTRI